METIKIRRSKDESAYSAIGRYYVKQDWGIGDCDEVSNYIDFENYGRHLAKEDVDVCIGEDYVVLVPHDGL